LLGKGAPRVNYRAVPVPQDSAARGIWMKWWRKARGWAAFQREALEQGPPPGTNRMAAPQAV
jgi:hypothetical protein